ncbi:spore germination protein [Neobacillus cucumis]|uniref:spore germination protein n=1 Tax=Neobacillus cucumis TaxID=1740721 RepID=UPI001E2C261C|nr:spore germination protein [Neobacillus cucumis]
MLKGSGSRMIRTNEKITTPQAAVIVINYILAAIILTLPRSAAQKVKTPDVWISVLIGGIIAMAVAILIAKLSQQFPTKTVFEYLQDLIGKIGGRLLGILICIYFFTISAYEVRTMAEVTRMFLLEGTPTWGIIMPFMWVGLYLILGGIPSIARLFEIIFPITVIFFLLVAFMSFKIFEIDNLRPILGEGVMPVIRGLETTALAYTGFDIMFILVPFMQQPKKAVKAVVVGVSLAIVFYLITVVMVIGALSVDGVLTRTWPTLDMIRSFEFPGLLFERFESLVLVIWIMQIFATYVITLYASALGFSQIFKKRIQPFMYGLLPIIYIVAMHPKNPNSLFKLGDWIGNAALFFFGAMPVVMLIIAKIKGKRHEKKH